jgi:hypothetical protein
MQMFVIENFLSKMVKSFLDSVEIKEFLDEKSYKYENTEFISDDPILIPHAFSNINDIEVSGFLTSVIAWGTRKSIIKNANKIIEFMDNSPYDFILNHNEKDLFKEDKPIHRTFNSTCLIRP